MNDVIALRPKRCWFIDNDSDTCFEIYEGTGVHVATAHDFKANADLIAAAPELLAALQLFVKQYDTCGPNSNFGRIFEDVKKSATVAIAKTEGRS